MQANHFDLHHICHAFVMLGMLYLTVVSHDVYQHCMRFKTYVYILSVIKFTFLTTCIMTHVLYVWSSTHLSLAEHIACKCRRVRTCEGRAGVALRARARQLPL
jgi:hypothetical protein